MSLNILRYIKNIMIIVAFSVTKRHFMISTNLVGQKTNQDKFYFVGVVIRSLLSFFPQKK